MPCMTYETPEEIADEVEHRSHMADMLCRMCRAAENTGSTVLLHPDIKEWWDEHKKRDRARK